MTPEEAIDAEKRFSKQFQAFIRETVEKAVENKLVTALNPMRVGIAELLTGFELLKESNARIVNSNLSMATELGRLTNTASLRTLEEGSILRKVDKFLELLKTIELADLKQAMMK